MPSEPTHLRGQLEAPAETAQCRSLTGPLPNLWEFPISQVSQWEFLNVSWERIGKNWESLGKALVKRLTEALRVGILLNNDAEAAREARWRERSRAIVPRIRGLYANISGYPVLWQLHNETLGLHLAKPIDDKHLVYYNVYENTVFCDWGRLVRSSGSSA